VKVPNVSAARAHRLANQLAFEALYEKIYESYDFTRKFELCRWYLHARAAHAENAVSDQPAV
jgi:hypothetical protein